VGAIVESPKFFPAFSGRKNLQLLAEAIGRPRGVADQVLEEAGLGDRGKDKYRTYSLGMKQRLAIAATLLKDPDLLIFDEPTNGLDPAGIREIRNTMRSLGEQGKTVLVSSHILDEVEQVADSVSIIGHGRLLASGPVSDVIGNQAATSVRVGVADPVAAQNILTESGYLVRQDGELLVVEGVIDGAEVTRSLAAHGLYLNELIPVRADLESVFLELTDDEGLETVAVTG
jgi:ABC-2 type transport system ATP-binding protein